MVFSSLTFLYMFLPGTLILYFVIPEKARNGILLIASLLFYFCGARLFLLLMIGEILISYAAGLLLERSDRKSRRLLLERSDRKSRELLPERSGQKRRRLLLALYLVLLLSVLCFFKYGGFLADTVNRLAGKTILPFSGLVLPIGISFYTFQCISYVIDVYRKAYPAERNILRFSTYVSFFPQLIAGPIIRFDSVRQALKKRKPTPEQFSSGLFRFTLGLGKKVLIADRLFAFTAACQSAADPSSILSWIEAAAFLLYVYYDFSGYSDMAIGLARCFGFAIPENFEYPLISTSFREFWRRWHISLGSWFRDYLYIPLGGNRKGLPRQLLNLLIVWLLTGIWHGAGWNYVLWGLSFGILLCFETLYQRIRDRRQGIKRSAEPPATPDGTPVCSEEIPLTLSEVPAPPLCPQAASGAAPSHDLIKRITKTLSRFAVFFLTSLLFVLFRFPTVSEAAAQFSRMFSSDLWSHESSYLIKNAAVILLIALIGASPLLKKLGSSLLKAQKGHRLLSWIRGFVILGILAVTTAYLVDGSFSPFLYFRF